VRDIAAAVCDTYEVEATQAETDTLAFIAELVQQGMLVLA
jgi:hypothetical protein